MQGMRITYLEKTSIAEMKKQQPCLAGKGPLVSMDSVCQGEVAAIEPGEMGVRVIIPNLGTMTAIDNLLHNGAIIPSSNPLPKLSKSSLGYAEHDWSGAVSIACLAATGSRVSLP